MNNAKTIKGYIIRTKRDDEYNNKTESGIIISTDFSHQKYIKQYAEVFATPDNDENVSAGDTLVFHYNIVAYNLKGGAREPSRFLIDGDEEHNYYRVPLDMAHAVIKPNGSIIMLDNYCFIKPYKKPEKKTESGIIYEREREIEGKDRAITEILHITNHPDLKPGDIVLLDTHANYEIELPTEKMWAIRTNFILLKYLD